MEEYLFILYLASGAFLANMIPVVGAKLNWLPSLEQPIDSGRKIRGRRIFGQNKTIRGFVLAVLAGFLFSLVQFSLDRMGILKIESLVGFFDFILFGILGGAGAILGDALESFFKRQLGISSGKPFIPFDQIDYMVGFLLATSLLMNWKGEQIIFLLVFALLFNPLVNVSAYFLRIKKTYW